MDRQIGKRSFCLAVIIELYLILCKNVICKDQLNHNSIVIKEFIMENKKYCRESLAIKTSLVSPPDTNIHGTMFGGKLMAYIDDVAAIAAMRHAQKTSGDSIK